MAGLSGMPRDQGWPLYEASFRQWMAGDWDATHPGGESYREIRQRVLPAIDAIRAAHHGASVVVVAHGVVIRVLITSLVEGYSCRDWENLGIDFTAINVLHAHGETWHATHLNGVAVGRAR